MENTVGLLSPSSPTADRNTPVSPPSSAASNVMESIFTTEINFTLKIEESRQRREMGVDVGVGGSPQETLSHCIPHLIFYLFKCFLLVFHQQSKASEKRPWAVIPSSFILELLSIFL